MEGKQKVALTFGLYQNDTLIRRETVSQDIVKVGKDAKSHLRVEDEQASRMHAVIEVASPEDITLIDLGNEPGTLVNGARVNKCKISVGDHVQIGGTKIILEKAEPLAAAAAAAPASAPPPAPAGGAVAATNPFGGTSPFAAPAATNPFGGTAPFGGGAGANPFAASPFGDANPFAPEPPADEVPADAPEGSYTYSMLRSGPAVPDVEVESGASAVEVMVMWDQSILHVAHLTPPRSFYVGEDMCDYFVPTEKLGTTRAPIVLADPSRVMVVLPPVATGTIEVNGQKMTIQEAIQGGMTQPCAELSGAMQMPLPQGGKARIVLENGLTFQVSTVNAGRAVAGHFAVQGVVLAYLALSGLVHGGLLAAMFFFMPPLDGTEGNEMTSDQSAMLKQMLQAYAEKEQEEQETEEVTESKPDDKEGGTGTRAKGEEGQMGNPVSHATNMRYGVKGPANNPDPHLARQAALQDARDFGMIGLLNTGAGGDPNAPTAIFGRDDSLGTDPMSARGNMWGDSIGDAFGAGGLGLSGIGDGGGGRGEGIGLGSIGTLGHGSGRGNGQGMGNGNGRLQGAHRAKPPQVRMGGTSVSGRLPAEVIQRIVRQHFGSFRMCYENGLRSNPELAGGVTVGFVIDASGAVSGVSNAGSSMPDSGVVSCVVRSFGGLSFPKPEGGVVRVTYPISFSPG